jgi:hypothetical protein
MPRLLVGDECDGIRFKCLAKRPSRDAPTFGRRDSLVISPSESPPSRRGRGLMLGIWDFAVRIEKCEMQNDNVV